MTIQEQHQRNLEQLARNEECFKQNEKRTRANKRYLRWLGWFPLAFMVRDAQAQLDAANVRLLEADAKLRDADTELVKLL